MEDEAERNRLHEEFDVVSRENNEVLRMVSERINFLQQEQDLKSSTISQSTKTSKISDKSNRRSSRSSSRNSSLSLRQKRVQLEGDIASLRATVALAKERQEKMGRESATQGPQGAISTKSRLIESLLPVKISLQEVNPELQNHLKLAVTLALVMENFYSQMRSRNDMPTVLEFARYVFVPTTLEFLKQLTDTGFCVLHLATLVV